MGFSSAGFPAYGMAHAEPTPVGDGAADPNGWRGPRRVMPFAASAGLVDRVDSGRSLLCGRRRRILLGCVPAVDDQLCAGDKLGLIGGEVEHAVGDVCRLAHMAQWVKTLDLLAHSGGIG